MTAPPDDTATDLHAVIAELRKERDVLAETLARRNSEYGERIAHQSATIDVLKAMSASPGNPQPVFDLITEQAARLCNVPAAAVAMSEFDGEYLHIRSWGGWDAETSQDYLQQFPMRPDRGTAVGRAILDRRAIHIRDVDQESGIAQAVRTMGVRSTVAIPLLRGERPIGVIAVGSPMRGGFADPQVELLRIFANQAVIAITSAEMYRALQERTAALAQRNTEYGERIEHQAATIDVLKAMSASPGDAQPVFDLITRRAQEVCNAPAVALLEYDGELAHFRSEYGSEPGAGRDALEAYKRLFPMAPTRASIACRAILDRQVVHIRDMKKEADLLGVVRDLGHRSNLAVPLPRDGNPIGVIALSSWEPGGFSDSQIELLKTFAEQAAIAITSAETYRALQTRTSDLQETLEYQTAISDVLKVISRSAFDLQPVLDTVVQTAARL